MLNHIVIMGRLTRDPELRTTQSGVSVTSFTVAVDRDYSGQNGQQKETDFIDCVAWRSTGEFVSKYFSKGSMIVVSGRLQSRKWQDNQGNKRVSWEINADSVYFGESKKNQDAGGNAPTQGGGYYAQQGQYGAAPPQQNSYSAAPSQQYGAPPRQQYGAPPQNQYGAPPQNQYGTPPQQYRGAQQAFTDLGDDDGDLPF